MSRFAPTGGAKVSHEELLELRNALYSDAHEAGYPLDTQLVRQHFDRKLARRLCTYGLPVGEMLRADVWGWLCIHLVPGLVKWRFARPDGSVRIQRFAGTLQRNAIGRLWLRGCVFDRGDSHDARWTLVDRISEDASVAILERPAISSDWRLARAVGERWLMSRESGRGADDLLREATKRIGVELAMRDLGSLPDKDLQDAIDACFDMT